MAKDRFRARPKRLLDNDAAERQDDQIAPEVASGCIDALQRWALVTANIAQGSHRANEAEMVDRVRDRYENKDLSRASYQNHHPGTELERSYPAVDTPPPKQGNQRVSLVSTLHQTPNDRKSPTPKDREADLPQAKRRRSRSPDAKSDNTVDGVALSGEWKLASEDEVKLSKKVKRTRTFIEID
ncbi:hypothetical protein E8E13_011002 [Curvularia kusanoi]|uniref:Uncharacterized protein n=1 Tax=Curvularia kusanoi TaxID=90978 RepID=A0A9P4TKE3_CURKU|nr:hypothetical protein E8E13_011002 [Curvularia kusanoi]